MHLLLSASSHLPLCCFLFVLLHVQAPFQNQWPSDKRSQAQKTELVMSVFTDEDVVITLAALNEQNS